MYKVFFFDKILCATFICTGNMGTRTGGRFSEAMDEFENCVTSCTNLTLSTAGVSQILLFFCLVIFRACFSCLSISKIWMTVLTRASRREQMLHCKGAGGGGDERCMRVLTEEVQKGRTARLWSISCVECRCLDQDNSNCKGGDEGGQYVVGGVVIYRVRHGIRGCHTVDCGCHTVDCLIDWLATVVVGEVYLRLMLVECLLPAIRLVLLVLTFLDVVGS